MNSDIYSLVDPGLVLVVKAVDDQGILQSPGLSSSKKEKKKSAFTDNPASKLAKSSRDKSAKSVPDSRSTKSSAGARIDALDQKWSDRFNRLEALLMARTLKKEPIFQTVIVTPTHIATVGCVKSTAPLIKPVNLP